MKKVLTVGLLALSFASCRLNVVNNIQAGNTPITFELLKQEAYGGRDEESTEVINTQAGLEKLYKELGWSDMPDVDFSKSNIVALFMGQKRTGGYSISIRKVTIEGDTATVQVLETSPEGNMASMVITAPYCIAVIPKTKNVVVE